MTNRRRKIQKVYISDQRELKTISDWIDFAAENDASFACNSDEDKIQIVKGPFMKETVIRELTEIKFFSPLLLRENYAKS